MEPYKAELTEATEIISSTGREKDDFLFEMNYLPPDPDGGGMFTILYEIGISQKRTHKVMKLIGGVGFKWVSEFERALKDGYFD